MEKLRIVDKDFQGGVQVLPEGFANIDPEKRRELLSDFNRLGKLSLTEVLVGWDLYARVPKEITAEKLDVNTTVIERVRSDIRSWQARASLKVLSQKEP